MRAITATPQGQMRRRGGGRCGRRFGAVHLPTERLKSRKTRRTYTTSGVRAHEFSCNVMKTFHTRDSRVISHNYTPKFIKSPYCNFDHNSYTVSSWRSPSLRYNCIQAVISTNIFMCNAIIALIGHVDFRVAIRSQQFFCRLHSRYVS